MENVKKGYPCPCCGYLTRSTKEYGTFDICPICFWEDDNIQGNDPNYVGGANEVSLIQAQQNFKSFGASERRFIDNVREPMEEEIPS